MIDNLSVSMIGAVGTLAVVLTVVFAWPQALQVKRSDDISGVSVITALLVTMTTATWLFYGLAVGDPAVIAANFATGAVAMFTFVTLCRRGAAEDEPIVAVVAGCAIALAATAVLSMQMGWYPTLIGLFGAALGIFMTVPQAWHTARGNGVAGVSLATYALLLAEMSAWLVYGLLRGNPVVWFTNLVGVAVVGAVTVVLVRSERAKAQLALNPAS